MQARSIYWRTTHTGNRPIYVVMGRTVKKLYKLYNSVTTEYYTQFPTALGDVHAGLIQTTVCAVQVEILAYTSQCRLVGANMEYRPIAVWLKMS